MHVAIQSNPNLVEGFATVGAAQREHGTRPMFPGTNILRPDVALGLN